MNLGKFREYTKNFDDDTEIYVQTINHFGSMITTDIFHTEDSKRQAAEYFKKYNSNERTGVVIEFHEQTHPQIEKELDEWMERLSPSEKEKVLADLCSAPH